MAYTFGAGTGDDITWDQGGLGDGILGARNGVRLVYGWWYPTTLTATRGLWSAGNTYGAEIDSTTSELRLRTDNTTDGQWTTTGVNLTTNEWKFLAFMNTNNNSGPTAAWRVWAGTISTAPTEVTVTSAVGPSGNFTGNANFYIGNKGTGTVAFQGDIENVGYLTTGTNDGPFQIATAGTITNNEAEFAYRWFVLPLWIGQPVHVGFLRGPRAQTIPISYAHIRLDTLDRAVRTLNPSNPTVDSTITPTINGATPSLNRGPRPYQHQIIHPVPTFGM